jgi:hypothetical protein
MAFLRFGLPTMFVSIVFAAAVMAGEPLTEELTEANYTTWRDHVLPRQWELAYQRIPWRASFWEAVIEAQEKDKPILLWTMNGHPLCNT